MKLYISLFWAIHFSAQVISQTSSPEVLAGKRSIDSAAIANWSDLRQSEPSISPNGKYFMYRIDNFPVGSRTLIIQSTQNEWKRQFTGAMVGTFSFDSKYAIFQSSDTLYIISMASNKQEYITGVSSFTYPKTPHNTANSNSGKLIVYKLKNNALVIRDLVSQKQFKLEGISDFLLSERGNVILTKKINKESKTEIMEWIDIKNRQETVIWSNEKNGIRKSIRSYRLNEAGNKIVFLTQDKSNAKNNEIWFYEPGLKEAEKKVSNDILKRNDGMIISNNPPFFSKSGKYIFFSIQHENVSQLKDGRSVQVDIWNYKDLVLQSLQAHFLSKNETISQLFIKTQFLEAVKIDNGKFIQLENDSVKVIANNLNEDIAIISKYQKFGDKFWMERQKNDYYLINFADETNSFLTTAPPFKFWLSPDKGYLIYFHPELKQYISYNIINKQSINISRSIPENLTDDVARERVTSNPLPAGLIGWLNNGNALVSDNYDIWELDPTGKKLPQNTTSGYGRTNNIKFDILRERQSFENEIYPINKDILLTAFWEKTKQIGFFKFNLNKKENPQLLSSHSNLIESYSQQTIDPNFSVKNPKTNNAVWILKMQTIDDAPNFYSTTNFKKLKQLTNFQPQKKYYWMKNELISWEMVDGRTCQGILFKPEDFNPNKKYPLIVHYYEKWSEMLHQFIRPDFNDGAINIPWFVSRGYLVFTPDIHYTVDHVTESVMRSVIPGINKLLNFPFIDSSAIGLQGHSFGGYETNILITESKLFAAAAEAAGVSNLISHYGSLLPTDRNYGQGAKHSEWGGQLRLSNLLWTDRSTYIENSPLFKADRVTTPLLIMHNKEDQAVPWGQAVELFIALRRLEKRVWMLQYDREGHDVNLIKNKMDYTTRLTQYFDHYLKGLPAPLWMTQGVPTAMKGITTGLNLDPSGSCGKDCKICQKWNKQPRLSVDSPESRP